MGNTRALDPVTVEVIRNALISAASEMTNTLVRTSFNPVLYEMLDFAADIFNADAELIGEGKGAVIFMGTVSFGIRATVEHLGKENINEGDIIVSCYSYFAGSHHPDVLVFKPVFYEGEIFAYAAVKAHWVDIGAAQTYGHYANTDMFQEGMILPGVKIVKKGVLNKEIVDIIRYNSRVPDVIIGDMTAQITACETGEKRLLGLIKKYGKDTLSAAMDAIMDHDEKIMRKAISEIPDGVYTAEAYLDDNGFDDNPVKICLSLTVKGDEMIFDTTGSAPQQPSSLNCPYPSTAAVCRLIAKMILDPHIRSSEGHWRPLTVISPNGSIFNPQPPAASYLYGWVVEPLGECIFKALADVLPEKVVARSGGDICVSLGHQGRYADTGKWFMSAIGQTPVGQGASFDRDGGDALIIFMMSGSEAIPIEIFEEKGPVLVERWALRNDSGGPGKFRGGLGVERQIQALADCQVGGIVEQTKFPAWGLYGGKSGLPNVGIIWPDTEKERRYGKISRVPFKKGERHLILTGGGGGWGNPLERDMYSVLDDVVKEYVSVESARNDYGVVITQKNNEFYIDESATANLHNSMKASPAL